MATPDDPMRSVAPADPVATNTFADLNAIAGGTAQPTAVPTSPQRNAGRYVLGDVMARSPADHLESALRSQELRGRFALVRMKVRGRVKDTWLLIKMRAEFARPRGAGGEGSRAPRRVP
jgi:hypothetical protein